MKWQNSMKKLLILLFLVSAPVFGYEPWYGADSDGQNSVQISGNDILDITKGNIIHPYFPDQCIIKQMTVKKFTQQDPSDKQSDIGVIYLKNNETGKTEKYIRGDTPRYATTTLDDR